MTAWQPGHPVPAGYCVEVLEDGTERLVASWPTSPCSEPIEEDEDGPKDIAILCEECYENGCWDTMWPGGDNDDAVTQRARSQVRGRTLLLPAIRVNDLATVG